MHLNTPPLTDGLLVSVFWFIAEMEFVHGWWMQNRLYMAVTQLLLEGNYASIVRYICVKSIVTL